MKLRKKLLKPNKNCEGFCNQDFLCEVSEDFIETDYSICNSSFLFL